MDAATALENSLSELFKALPLNQAMGSLVVSTPNVALANLVSGISAPAPVLAGLWLYVDDLDRSHSISQEIHTPTGSYLHAIMHRREGDFWNSKYWFRKVGDHPTIAQIGYDPFLFVDDCEADRGKDAAHLVELQRREWKALFDLCVMEAVRA